MTAVSGGSISASFVYDADGNRVKGTVNGTTTIYIAGLYEYQGGATTLYYEGNALRRTGYATDNGVFYLLQDQLKSSSTLANQNGTVNSRNYFYPFGGNRGGAAFSALTTKRFTSQYHEQGLPGGEGLSYYGARWYDAQLGRFTGPDTIVPGAGNPQALNRFAYTLNNPLKYIDPSGHGSMCTADPYDPGCSQTSPNYIPSSWPKPVAPTIFTRLLFDVPVSPQFIWMNHFGATSFARDQATGDYRGTSGLHGGTDFLLTRNTQIVSGTKGVVEAFDTGDANPNIVVRVNTKKLGDLYILYGHVDHNPALKAGDSVDPDTMVGTVAPHKTVDHLHLTVYAINNKVRTVYNPLYFFPPTTFDSDAHLRVQDVGALATNQTIFRFNYSSNHNWWAGDDVGAVDTEGNRVDPSTQ